MLGKLCRLEKRCGLNRDKTLLNTANLPPHRAAIRELVEV
jgi:hypothetical protein